MPYTQYKCKDGELVGIEDCLSKCRLFGEYDSNGEPWVPAGRCLSLQTLRAISEQRKWTGKPSTTQLLKGTREVFLELTQDYHISPKDSVFMLFGTEVHGGLESHVSTASGEVAEIRIEDDYSTGAFDYYTPENGGTLVDTKTYGSYKTAHTLGYYMKKEETDYIYKSGQKKGQKKTINVLYKDGPHLRFDLALQLNDYRMKIEKKLGLPVANMCCQILVRDGNTHVATSRGITEPSYLVPINKISDIWVERYMRQKSQDLIYALEHNVLPTPCSHRETWSGRKCKDYCNVWNFCEEGRKAHGIQ